MQLIDNSDLAWLIYADWLDDNDRPGAIELRAGVSAPVLSSWHYEWSGGNGGSSVGGSSVGGSSVGGSIGSVGIGSVGSGGSIGSVGSVGVGGSGGSVGSVGSVGVGSGG